MLRTQNPYPPCSPITSCPKENVSTWKGKAVTALKATGLSLMIAGIVGAGLALSGVCPPIGGAFWIALSFSVLGGGISTFGGGLYLESKEIFKEALKLTLCFATFPLSGIFIACSKEPPSTAPLPAYQNPSIVVYTKKT